MTNLSIDELEFIKKLVEVYQLGHKFSPNSDQLVLNNYVMKANQAFMQRIIDKLEIEILAK